MEKINSLTSENIVQQNIERLQEIFPTAFSEGKLIVEELQVLVGEYLEKDKEFYQMTWAGKTQAQREANKVSTGTLRPNKADSKDWDTTGNIFIEGDNLEVLKLLQKTYNNQIKMIYIDPPYNTGQDFVYKDNYKDSLNNYLEITGQTDEEGKKLSTNSDSDGRYHSNWLNMMYPRLKLARNLLTDDGVIFISIDDNEQANLKKICDEIFGEENFRNIIATKRGTKSVQAQFDNIEKLGIAYEYLFVYSKNSKFRLNQFYFNLDETKEGSWNNHWRGTDRPTMRYELFDYTPTSGQWRWAEARSLKAIENHEIMLKEIGNSTPSQLEIDEWYISKNEEIDLLRLSSTGKPEHYIAPTNTKFGNNLWTDINVSSTSTLKKLDINYFDNPKNPKLISRIIEWICCEEKSIILDFFSGSGTTAHAVMALNAEDGGNRKCISVQLPEPTDEKREAYKAGYKTIAEITKERIRRAGELIKQENKDKEGIDRLDIGFRAFKLDSSNIQAWDTSIENFEGQLDVFEANNGDSIKSDRTEEDVLFEILLKYGLDLTLPVQEKTVAGSIIYNIGFGAMYICLSNQINVAVATAIGEWHKESADSKPSVIFKDAGFANDADKTNTVQTLRQAGIENVKSI